MYFTGLLEQEITVGEESRTAKLYIPEDAKQGDYFIILTVPDGESTAEFMVKSGWIDLAEKEDLCLFVMEPENEKWGSVKDESAYIEAAYAALIAGKYYLPFPTFYIVGYGNGGTALQTYAMKKSITVASAVYIDASDIDSTYLSQMQTETYANTDITFGEVPVPTWIINKKNTQLTKNVIKYWKTANECTDKEYGFNDGSIYLQKDNTDSIFTPKSISKVAVLEKKVNYNDPSVAKMLYDFLSETTRYGGAAGGNVLAARPDYEKLGVEFKTMTVDGYKREYLVYVPKALKESSEKAPVVYSLHGANQTYKMMFDIARWFEVADARNFILVMPTATVNTKTAGKTPTPTWNASGDKERADDITFLKALVKEVDINYNVDSTRRYFSGQSNGCMMSNYVGMMMSEYFAAIGATSGPILNFENPAAVAISNKVTPFFMMFGETDLWNWKFTSSGPVRLTLDYWITRNGAGVIDSIDGQYINNRYNNYIWTNDAGVPLVRYTMTSGRGHSFLPDEMFTIWDEWFAVWKQDSNGTSVYMKN